MLWSRAFWTPRRASAEPARSPRARREPSARHPRPLLLVAHGDPAVRVMLMASLNRLGYETLVGQDGAEAADLLRAVNGAVAAAVPAALTGFGGCHSGIS